MTGNLGYDVFVNDPPTDVIYNAAIDRYPDHLARTVLWAGASALYGVREHPGQDAERVAQILVAGWL